MANPAISRRWMPKQAGVRLALALLAAALGYFAVMQALAMVIQKHSPGEAHTLAPGNGVITGQLSSSLAGPSATKEDRAQADRFARLALRQDPTAIDAAATLGLNAQIRGDTLSARQLFAYAETLSRRNLQTELWAIDDAVVRNDLPAILMHYDVALRTSPAASELLYPSLMVGITDPSIRSALAQTLAHQPAWTDEFLNYAVANNTDPVTVAALFLAVSHLGGTIPYRDSASVINTLIATGHPSQAWSYYAAIHPGASRHMSRDPGFDNPAQTPSALDWVPVNHGGISASIQPDGRKGGVLTFTAPPSIGGRVVGQIEMLPPGDYVFEGRSRDIDQADDSRPYWSLTCISGRELGRVNVPNSTESGRLQRRFTVPTDCPVQVLAFNVRPSSNVSGVIGQIDWALLRPAG